MWSLLICSTQFVHFSLKCIVNYGNFPNIYAGSCHTVVIMAYGSMPYVGMALKKKNGGHIKSTQMTRLKCLR